MNLEYNTEEKILEAAKEVFIQKGLEGARMQEIADEAGINKSLLHYYYRTKDKLFDAVFRFAFSKFIPRVEKTISSEKPITEKIKELVEHYITLLQKNQFIPIFILHELSRKPERIYELMKSSGVRPEFFMEQIQKQMKKENIQISSPQHLLINILSLCVFPFAARPLMQSIFFEGDKKKYNDFIESRKKEVADFIIAAILNKKQ